MTDNKLSIVLSVIASLSILGSGCGTSGTGSGGTAGTNPTNSACNVNNNYCGAGPGPGQTAPIISTSTGICTIGSDIGACGVGNSAGGIDGLPPGATILNSSNEGATRDTDLQQASLQSANLQSRAQAFSNQFQMNLTSATQLVVLSDRLQLLTSQGVLTDEDRDALTQSALAVAGISSADLNQAVQKSINGDNTASDALVEEAAVNLGMPSSAGIREEILPALDIHL